MFYLSGFKLHCRVEARSEIDSGHWKRIKTQGNKELNRIVFHSLTSVGRRERLGRRKRIRRKGK